MLADTVGTMVGQLKVCDTIEPYLKQEIVNVGKKHNIVGANPAMLRVCTLISL
jgi:hypothetical protein